MTIYNITALQQNPDMATIATVANTGSNGALFGIFIIAIFVIILLSLKRFGFAEVLLADGFLCFIISTIAAYGHFLNVIFPLFFLILTALDALYLWATS